MATHASRNDPLAHPRRTDKRLANHGPAVTRTRTARLMRPGRGGRSSIQLAPARRASEVARVSVAPPKQVRATPADLVSQIASVKRGPVVKPPCASAGRSVPARGRSPAGMDAGGTPAGWGLAGALGSARVVAGWSGAHVSIASSMFEDQVLSGLALAAHVKSGLSGSQAIYGACRSEGHERLVAGEHVSDRFGELAGELDGGELGAALATQPALGALVALLVKRVRGGGDRRLHQSPAQVSRALFESGPRRSTSPDCSRAGTGRCSRSASPARRSGRGRRSPRRS